MNQSKYPLKSAESKGRAKNTLNALLYVVLAAVILITGAHAVMLVLSQAASYTVAAQSGMVSSLLTLIRVAFPLMVEAAAIVAGVGFIQSRWRGNQATIGMAIEGVWFLFAAANMITFFAVERGQTLQGWQSFWIQYGLPLSALVAGVLTYSLLRFDPDHQRADEEALAAETQRANEFNAENAVKVSPAMALIQRRRVWRDTINQLAADFEALQIIAREQYRTPQLQAAYLLMRVLSDAGVAPPIAEKKKHILDRLQTAKANDEDTRA